MSSVSVPVASTVSVGSEVKASEHIFAQQHREVSRSHRSVRELIVEEDELQVDLSTGEPVGDEPDHPSRLPEEDEVDATLHTITTQQNRNHPQTTHLTKDETLSQNTASTHAQLTSPKTKPSTPQAQLQAPSQEVNVTSATLTWQHLSVSVPSRGVSGGSQLLLRDVSGCLSGGMWAVMGPSGCGKSTLLNTLACRLDVNTSVSGEMRLNGRPYHNAELKKVSGYVMQDDLLNPNLTVRETLHYTAALRLPRTFTAEMREQRVDEVIREMGLTHCQHVIVGDPSKKGISGGERRRVCIGMELITRPTLLFLDEPTSGLDSVTAHSLIELLHRITSSGKCSMMISIHQPQARLFSLFDRLLLLKNGRILFQGSIPEALHLFEECGFPVPQFSNPADHILDVITPPMDSTLTTMLAQEGHESVERAVAGYTSRAGTAADGLPLQPDGLHTSTDAALYEIKQQVAQDTQDDVSNSVKLLSKYSSPNVDLGFGGEKPFVLERDQISWWKQFTVLVHRNGQDAFRRKLPLLSALLQSCIIAILFGFAFFDIGTGQSSVTRRNPACFFYCVNQGVVGGLTIINSFPAERALMLRERAAGTYFASAYFAAKIVVDTLVSLPIPVIFGTIAYWVIGFQPLAAKFFTFLVLVILCNLSATSLALMISAICKTTDFATTVLPMVLEICRLFGGFYLSPANLPKYFSWLDALSYIKYSYVGIALTEFSGLELKCDQSSGSCTPNGVTTINALGLDYITIGGCIGTLIGYVIFCQIVAFIAVRFNKSI